MYVKHLTGAREAGSIIDRWRLWLFEHRPVFRFVLFFGVLVGAFYLFVLFVPFYQRQLLPKCHQWIAESSGAALVLLGQNATVNGNIVSSTAFSVGIVWGCDAIDATGLFMCAVLAFPAGLARKAAGIIAGTFVLAILNLVRVVCIFLTGVYFPRAVDFIHIEVCQALFVLIAVVLWVMWLIWAAQQPIKARITSIRAEQDR